MRLTRRESLAAAGGLAIALRFPGRASAASYACYGWPALAGEPPLFPYPTIYQETQCWWMQGNTGLSAPGANFAFASAHVHAGIAFPTGEQQTRINGEWVYPFFCQLHNFQGGHGKNMRGGGWLIGSPIPSVQAPPHMQNPTSSDVSWRGTLKNSLNPAAGKREQRFTFDTTSPFGKRMYQSGAWWTFVGQAGAGVPATTRGWYASTGYTNATLRTPLYRASSPVKAGSACSYSLAQGATHAFAYADPNIHAGSKGTVIFENRVGSSGTFSIPAGTKVLMLGSWEKASDGWNAGVLRLPLA